MISDLLASQGYRGTAKWALKIVSKHPILAFQINKPKKQFEQIHSLVDINYIRRIYPKNRTLSYQDLLRTVRQYKTKCCHHNDYLYAVVRWLRPGIVVETGIGMGFSARAILSALEDNQKGELYSIGLPDVEYFVPEFDRMHSDKQPFPQGFYVPNSIRRRWHVIAGDARQELLLLLKNFDSIDMFHHDSLHLYDHMLFEFTEAWPYIRAGGLLLSDDVFWGNAFKDFAASHQIEPQIFFDGRFDERVPAASGMILKQ